MNTSMASRQREFGPSPVRMALLISCFLIPVSLIPASKGFFFHLPLLPRVWWNTNLILLFGLLVVCLRPWLGYSPHVSRSTRRLLLWPLLLLSGWQILSLLWNEREGYLKSYSLLQSMAMAAGVAGGVLIVSGMSFNGRIRLGRGVVLVLSFVFAVYVGLSFVFPNWRPSSGFVDRTEESLGFIRMFGPLGKSTTLLYVLLPCLGFSLGMLFLPGYSRVFWLSISLFLFFATLSTGSRGAILCLFILGACLAVSMRLRAAWLIVPPVLLLIPLVLVAGVPERFKHFEDRARLETYTTAWRAFSDSPTHVLFGIGHGELYSALHDVTERKLWNKDRWYLSTDNNQYGFTLRNSHNAILRTLAETGIVGFTLLVIPLGWTTKRLLMFRARMRRDPHGLFAKCALSGCVAAIPYMGLDEFFVSGHWLVFLWCFFAVIGAESQQDADASQALSQQGPNWSPAARIQAQVGGWPIGGLGPVVSS